MVEAPRVILDDDGSIPSNSTKCPSMLTGNAPSLKMRCLGVRISPGVQSFIIKETVMAKITSSDIKTILDLKGIPAYNKLEDNDFKIGDWKRIKKYKTSKGIRRFFAKQNTPFIAYVDELPSGNIETVIRVANLFEALAVQDFLKGDYYIDGVMHEEAYENEDAFNLAEGLLPEEFSFGVIGSNDADYSLCVFIRPKLCEYYDQHLGDVEELFKQYSDGESSECHFSLNESAGSTPEEIIKNFVALGFVHDESLDYIDEKPINEDDEEFEDDGLDSRIGDSTRNREHQNITNSQYFDQLMAKITSPSAIDKLLKK